MCEYYKKYLMFVYKEEVLVRNIQDYVEKYKKRSFEDYKIIYRRKEIMKQIEKYNPEKILEIGIGEEPLFKYIDGIDFTIVEPSEEFIKSAERDAIDSGKTNNVKLIKGFFEDIVEANIINDKFDMIICASLLHEVENPKCLLKAIYEISYDSTVIVINVPNAYSLHRLIGIEAGIIEDVYTLSENSISYQQHSVFDKKILHDMLSDIGFNIYEEGTFFVKPFSHEQMWNCLQNNIIDDVIVDALYEVGNKYLNDYGSELYTVCKKGVL